MRRFVSIMSGLVLITVAVAYGCSDDETTPATEATDAGNDLGSSTPDRSSPPLDSGGNDSSASTKKAKATFAATGLPDSGTPTGTIEIADDGTQATVQISINGATNGYHGVHIHANGDCANNDAGFGGAAGGHWNPTDAGHGFPTGATHHAGDLGNILVTNGTGATSVTTTTIKLTDGDPLNPVGKAVIFHQGTDDGTTQPTGDAGTRAACGILQKQ
jgi:superoxide dismutase, Cu-Zn family